LTDYGPSGNVVPEQAIRTSLETLSIPYGFADLEAPTHPPPPPLILSTHSQTCNALGRVVAGNPKSLPSNITTYSQSTHLRTIDLSLHLTDFGPVPGPLRLHVPIPLAPLGVALYCVAREHIQEGTRVRVTESLNKRTIIDVQIGFLGRYGEESREGEKGCKRLDVNIVDIYRP
jgi:hypothetical protein